ncbi:hypothetical protein [Paraburkholderia dinghuensis]|uniref:Uncharacterized protein n=1 Tax=Paraburkholderia dinghuensis TaxID=2305225 RepID=A0A3N6MN67_9BURK|nr:hypothetical protein [Paraburkholderia dinghuensis]RQH04988.1 hypothetical protein D1Y85_16385 [Paraburkholderia dinghuensis]
MIDPAEFLLTRRRRRKLFRHADLVGRLVAEGFNYAEIADYLGLQVGLKVSRVAVREYVLKHCAAAVAVQQTATGITPVHGNAATAESSPTSPTNSAVLADNRCCKSDAIESEESNASANKGHARETFEVEECGPRPTMHPMTGDAPGPRQPLRGVVIRYRISDEDNAARLDEYRSKLSRAHTTGGRESSENEDK